MGIQDMIKITNVSGHSHGLKIYQPMSGMYAERNLKDKQYTLLTIEQFIDMYQRSKAFKRGYLHFDVNKLPEEAKMIIGVYEQEIDGEVVVDDKQFKEDLKLFMTDEEITAAIKGRMGDFNAFISKIKEVDEVDAQGFYKRVINIAMGMEDLNVSKAEKLEEVTGINFRENKKLSKES